MKIDIRLLAICLISCVVSSLITSSVFLGVVDTKFEKIEKRLTEIDGRRNAQYGVLKAKIEGK